MKENMTIIGKIVSSHGLKGLVKVFPYTDFLERCYDLNRVYLSILEECEMEKRKPYYVEQVAVHKRIWLIKFSGVNTREDSDELLHQFVSIPAEERVPLPDGSYYYDQVIGLQVFSTEGFLLGTVKEILKTGSNDVYIIDPVPNLSEKKEILIPAITEIVQEMNPNGKFMVVKLLEGII